MRVSKALRPNARTRTSPSTKSANRGVPDRLDRPAASIAFASPRRRCAGASFALKWALQRAIHKFETAKAAIDREAARKEVQEALKKPIPKPQ